MNSNHSLLRLIRNERTKNIAAADLRKTLVDIRTRAEREGNRFQPGKEPTDWRERDGKVEGN